MVKREGAGGRDIKARGELYNIFFFFFSFFCGYQVLSMRCILDAQVGWNRHGIKQKVAFIPYDYDYIIAAG